ncbi:alpha/beta hydrolase [Kineosporia rhizophila]|uniref:alpha/beta hydrolase n=1 Tax=Kineosporia TaxID=49184 RepID=UPI001E53C448|nr:MULTISPECIES: alpha/beta hydrolase [Kineosporia]MCE0538554.1 alpha/beta hydrolase [Kineosporia rhizophila]GLY19650.1 esterase [Kineosporia sp. NBRC 101677]
MITPPPFDAELKTVLDVVNQSITPTLRPEHLQALRGPGFTPSLEQLLEGRAIVHEEHTVPGPEGAPDVLVSVFRPRTRQGAGPGFFFTHVGGMIFGDRFVGVAPVVDYVERFNAVVVTVEYRLAPENPAPAALEDSYAALVWTAKHAAELGIDPERLITIGGSAGGGLTAGITMMARDRGFPALAGQVLMYAMLDERNDSVSARQIDGIGIWDRTSNDTGWNFYLGDRRGGEEITAYESALRATDFTGLPATYVEAGSAEVFRDEDVAYASAVWAAGGEAELHIWPGGYHLFELLAPEAALSVAARETRAAWIARLLTR